MIYKAAGPIYGYRHLFSVNVNKRTNQATSSQMVDVGRKAYASAAINTSTAQRLRMRVNATFVWCKLHQLRSSSEHLGEHETTPAHKNRRAQRATRCLQLNAPNTGHVCNYFKLKRKRSCRHISEQ